MKILLTALAAVMVIGAVATATPAQARCWWNGYSWQCAQRYHYGYNPWRYGHRNWGYNGGRYYGGGWRNGGGYYR